MSKIKVVLFSAMLALLVPVTALAASYQTGENPGTTSGQTVNDNLYLAGENATVEGTVNGDVVVFSGNAKVNGTVNGDVLVFAGKLEVNGTVNGDLRVAGGEMRINGTVNGDADVAGGTVVLGQQASIQKDMVVAAGNVDLAGHVGQWLKVYAGQVVLSGNFAGNVDVGSGQLRVASGAVIGGDLNYHVQSPANIESGSTIKGKTTAQVTNRRPISAAAKLAGALFSFITYLILGLLLLWLFHRPFTRLADTVLKEPGKSFLYGVAAFFLAPIAVIFLFLTILGIPIALLLTMVYIVSVVLAKLFVALAAGTYIFGRAKIKQNEYLALAAGLVVFALIGVIPVLGVLANLIIWFFGLGSIFLALRKAHRP